MKKLTNVRASRLALIHNESKRLQIPHEMLLRRYAFDRFLHRMMASQEQGKLVLKGAMALYAYSKELLRPSKDIDFLGNAITPENVLPIVTAIASTPPDEDDGIEFDIDTFIAEPIQVKDEESGTRVTGIARMGNIRIPLKIEVSFGHLVTPEPNFVTIPTIIPGEREIKVLAYTRETILAEKFQTVIVRGVGNTRIKDFFDIRALQRTQFLDGEVVVAAFEATFGRRETTIPDAPPPAFQEDFIRDSGTRAWANFLKKSGIQEKTDFHSVIEEIEPFCMGFAEMARGVRNVEDWTPGEGFTARAKAFSM